ncbi:hypothetical protein [Escherichia coli]|uniref:hypothetical protein n=1 Tax=Escherichia coli TaxID=562 RepID=UPI003D36A22D
MNKPEQLPEWRKALNQSVENYQSARSWYEENQDNPSAEQDMDAAAGEIEKLIKQYGVLIVLNLLDEIDELQERRKADGAEPVAWTDEEELRDANVAGTGYLFGIDKEANKFADPRRQIMLYRHAQPAPVVPDENQIKSQIQSIWWTSGDRNCMSDETAGKILAACLAAMLQAGNSPVTPDGYVLVPKEMTPEMMRAVQIKTSLAGMLILNYLVRTICLLSSGTLLFQ